MSLVIRCKMRECPYNDNVQNFCCKDTVVSIDQLGMCQVIWRRGERRQYSPLVKKEDFVKKEMKIIQI